MSLRMARNFIELQSVFVLGNVVSIRDKFLLLVAPNTTRNFIFVVATDDSM